MKCVKRATSYHVKYIWPSRQSQSLSQGGPKSSLWGDFDWGRLRVPSMHQRLNLPQRDWVFRLFFPFENFIFKCSEIFLVTLCQKRRKKAVRIEFGTIREITKQRRITTTTAAQYKCIYIWIKYGNNDSKPVYIAASLWDGNPLHICQTNQPTKQHNRKKFRVYDSYLCGKVKRFFFFLLILLSFYFCCIQSDRNENKLWTKINMPNIHTHKRKKNAEMKWINNFSFALHLYLSLSNI